MKMVIDGWVSQQRTLREQITRLDAAVDAGAPGTWLVMLARQLAAAVQGHLRLRKEVALPELARFTTGRDRPALDRVRAFQRELEHMEQMLPPIFRILEGPGQLSKNSAEWAGLKRVVARLLEEEREIFDRVVAGPATDHARERRTERRVACNAVATMLQPWKMRGRIVDVSLRGAAFLLPKSSPPVGSEVLAEFSLPRVSYPLTVRAEVRHVHAGAAGDGSCFMGLRFVSLNSSFTRAIASYVSTEAR